MATGKTYWLQVDDAALPAVTARTSWLQVEDAAAPPPPPPPPPPPVTARTSWLQLEDTAAAPPPPAPPGVTARTSWLQIDGVPIVAPPGLPTSVLGVATGDDTATLSWVSGGGEDGFRVQLEVPAGSGNWIAAVGAANPTGPGVQTFAATGLPGATAVTPRVQGFNSGGDSAWVVGPAFATDNAAGGGGEIPYVRPVPTLSGTAATAITATSIVPRVDLDFPPA